MTRAISAAAILQLLANSGWQQFWLDAQGHLCPPCTTLAQWCGLDPQVLENSPLESLFTPTSRELLASLLAELTLGRKRYIPATTLRLQASEQKIIPVEIMLCVTAAKGSRRAYAGFVRPLSGPNSDMTEARISPAEEPFGIAANLDWHIASVSDLAPVTGASEEAPLFDQIQRQVDRITGLLQASHALSTLDLQNILDTIVQKAGSLLEATHTVVYLADYADRQIRATAAYSIGDMVDVPTPPFGFEEGTVGWVLKHHTSLRINDVKKDKRFIQASPQSTRIVNLVAVPLIVKGEAIGALEATHKINGGDFTSDDEALLSAFASQAAIAIHNARLYQETQEQVKALTILTQTSEAITKAANFDQLLKIVLDSTLSIIGAEQGAMVLVDPQSQSLQIEAIRGLDPEFIAEFNRLHLSQNMGTFGEVFRTREILEIRDSQSDPRVYLTAETNWDIPKSFTHVPLTSGDEFMGLITLYALPDSDTRPLLQAVADMAAVAIDKARLFKQTDQRLAEVSTLYTLAEQMTRVLDLDRVTEFTVTILKRALDCSGCCLFLTVEPRTLVLKASSGWPADSQQLEFDTDRIAGLATDLIENPYPLYIKDALADGLSLTMAEANRKRTAANQENEPKTRIRSIMIVPLVAKDKVLGALSINDERPDAFDQAEGRLLTIAAAQISTAIENIRLYDRLEQRALELEAALNEVEEANRLKSEFVQNVSHELRTPLTFILSYVELILEGSLGQVSPAIREKLEIVSDKTKVTTRLVEDIVSLQKIEAGNLKLSIITPYELVTRATYGAIASASQYGLDIDSQIAPNLPSLEVDVDRIGQVFDNLVANALKFSPSGSKINIRAELDEDMIKFSVQDYGIGIPADKLDKVFERFYQIDGSTTRRYKGTGLGLAIIKQIVEVHQGQIAVESVVNEGTTFSFWLPIYRPTNEKNASQAIVEK